MMSKKDIVKKDMNKKLKGLTSAQNRHSLMDIWQNRQLIFQMLKAVWKGNYTMRLGTNIAIILTILYVISPIDFLPDFIPVAGWIDDGFIFLFLMKRLLKEAFRWEQHYKFTEVQVVE